MSFLTFGSDGQKKVVGTNKEPEIEARAVGFKWGRVECICILEGNKPTEKRRLKKEGRARGDT